jgi:hypothetical protein
VQFVNCRAPAPTRLAPWSTICVARDQEREGVGQRSHHAQGGNLRCGAVQYIGNPRIEQEISGVGGSRAANAVESARRRASAGNAAPQSWRCALAISVECACRGSRQRVGLE